MQEEKIIGKFEEIDARFDQVDARFDEHDQRFDRIEKSLISHDGRLQNIEENMAPKSDMSQIMTALDRQTVILNRLDHDRMATTSRVDRIERDVERLKTHTGLL